MHLSPRFDNLRLPDSTIDLVVWIPAYNSGRWIRDALNSALEQDYQSFVILVFDDSSTDDTVSIVEKYVSLYPDKVFLVRSPVRSFGEDFALFPYQIVKSLKNRYLALLDADDIWISKSKLSKCVQLLESDEFVSAISHRLKPVDQNGVTLDFRRYVEQELVAILNCKGAIGRMVRKISLFVPTSSLVMRLNMYPLEMAEFISRSPVPDLLIKTGLKLKGPIKLVADELGSQRFHKSSNWTSKPLFSKIGDTLCAVRLASKAWGPKVATGILLHFALISTLTVVAFLKRLSLKIAGKLSLPN